MPKDIVLINPPIRLNDKPRNFPHGLGAIAAILLNEGIDVGVIDANGLRMTDDMVIEEIQKVRPRFVGIGGIITTYKWIKNIVPQIRRAVPEAMIIIGGGVATAIPKIVKDQITPDFLIQGEGEDAILREVFLISPKMPIADSLDNLPITPYHLFPMTEYLNNPVVGFGRDMDLVTSRGCPYDCNFCYRLSGTKWRSHSPEYVMELIEWLRSRYEIDFISFQDDCFVINRNRVLKICEMIRHTQPDLKWSCTGRVGLCDVEMLKEMRASGCVSVSYGIESGSNKMLNLMGKKNTAQEAAFAIADTRAAGLLCPTSFIYGYPGEGPDTIIETQEFCVQNVIPLSSYMYATPYPGTKLYEQVRGLIMAKFITEEAYILALCDAGDCNSYLINLCWPIPAPDYEWLADDLLVTTHARAMAHVNYLIGSIDNTDQMKELLGTRLYEKYLKQCSEQKNAEHRKLHGFNLGSPKQPPLYPPASGQATEAPGKL